MMIAMRSAKFVTKLAGVAAVLGVITLLCALPMSSLARAQPRFGAQAAEAAPGRRQQWTIPSPDRETDSQAMLYRPAGDGPFRLAVIAHASTQNALRRAQMPQPDYAALVSALVARSFAVLVPERPGHGGTGGPYLEDQGGCDDADYEKSGHATASAIRVAMTFMLTQPFISKQGVVIAGHSAGGWGALALAASDPKIIARIIVFAPGRGGHANDRPRAVCAQDRLIAAAGTFGHGARVPVTWLVAQNDSYFSPELSRQMVEAFRSGGGHVDFRVLPAFGEEGHWPAERGDDADIANSLNNLQR